MTVLSAATLLFVVMDPFGNIPVFLVVVKDLPEGRKQKVIIREMLIALFVLLIFLFLGRYILDVLQINTSALLAAGGMVLFLIGIKMVFPYMAGDGTTEEVGEAAAFSEPLIVPLAIPLVAGPSALATLVLIMNRNPQRWLDWLLALLLSWTVTSLILASSTYFARVLGKRGLIAIERLMGMVLVAIAINMILNGVAEFFQQWFQLTV